MPNKHKGEVSLKAGDKEYIFKLTFNRLVELEEMGIVLIEGFEATAANIRKLFFALASGQNGVESLEDAGDLLDTIGFTKASELTGEVISLFFQSEEETRKKEIP